MGEREISGRVIGLVIGGFVLLVGIQVWLHQAEQAEATRNGPTFSPTEIKETGEEIDIGGDERTSAESPRVDEATRRKIRKLRNGDVSERRSAALQLSFRPHPAAEQVLLDGLEDPDREVAEQCSQGLLKLWRTSDSAVAGKLMERALKAYERGRWDAALRHLNNAGKLDPDISEVYRLKGRIWFRRNSPDKALENAKKAISLQPNHFQARFLMARCYMKQDREDEALRQLQEALEIYPYFTEATQLKESLTSGGEGDDE